MLSKGSKRQWETDFSRFSPFLGIFTVKTMIFAVKMPFFITLSCVFSTFLLLPDFFIAEKERKCWFMAGNIRRNMTMDIVERNYIIWKTHK